ncbi:ORF108 [Ranid herpesvirus 1]|uniref:ORF108 n=1 Tax=Ranid herpesvirus 1 TaxID=85655 RepID=Q14VM2_9VIRU|nr:ORF108 [Ranid herpesvirus 1]ABG25713.1 ORF108 [Ranid herpesvirus 1]
MEQCCDVREYDTMRGVPPMRRDGYQVTPEALLLRDNTPVRFPPGDGRIYFIVHIDMDTIFYIHNDTPDGSVIRDPVRIDGNVATLTLGPGRPLAFGEGENPESHAHLFAPRYIAGATQPCTPAITLRWYISQTNQGNEFHIPPLLLWWSPLTNKTIGTLRSKATNGNMYIPGMIKFVCAAMAVEQWKSSCVVGLEPDHTPWDTALRNSRVTRCLAFTPGLCVMRDVARQAAHQREEDQRYADIVRSITEKSGRLMMVGAGHDGTPFMRLLDEAPINLDLPASARTLLPNPRLGERGATVGRADLEADVMIEHLRWDMARCGCFEDGYYMGDMVLCAMGISKAFTLSDLMHYAAHRNHLGPSFSALQDAARNSLPRVPRILPCRIAVENGWFAQEWWQPTAPQYYPSDLHGAHVRSTTRNAEYDCCSCGTVRKTPRVADPTPKSNFEVNAYGMCLSFERHNAAQVFNACCDALRAATGRVAPRLLSVSYKFNAYDVLKHFARCFCPECESEQEAEFWMHLHQNAKPRMQERETETAMHQTTTSIETDLPPLSRDYAPIYYDVMEMRSIERDAALYLNRPGHTFTVTNTSVLITQLYEDGSVTLRRIYMYQHSAVADSKCISNEEVMLNTIALLNRDAWWDLSEMPFPIQRLAVALLLHHRPYLTRIFQDACKDHCKHIGGRGNEAALSVRGSYALLFNIPIADGVSRRISRNITICNVVCIDREFMRCMLNNARLKEIVAQTLKEKQIRVQVIKRGKAIYEHVADLHDMKRAPLPTCLDFVYETILWTSGVCPSPEKAPVLDILLLFRKPELYDMVTLWMSALNTRHLTDQIFKFVDPILKAEDLTKRISDVALVYLRGRDLNLTPAVVKRMYIPRDTRTAAKVAWLCAHAGEPVNTHSCVACEPNDMHNEAAPPRTVVLPPCQHVLCLPCFAALTQGNAPLCPVCATTLEEAQ